MLRRNAIALAFLATIVALGLLVLSSHHSRETENQEDVLDESAVALENASKQSQDSLSRIDAAEATSPTATGDSSTTEPGVLFGLQLRVCDPAGVPLPDAVVWWYPAELDAGLGERSEAHGRDWSQEARAKELCAEPLITDSTGRVVIPVEYGRSVMVFGRAGEWSGGAGLRPWGRFGEETLALRRLQSIAVLVVDDTGEPIVGARVGIESQAVGWPQPTVHYWRGTDADGVATLDEMDAQWVADEPPLGWSRWVALLEPFEPRVRVRWDPKHPPSQPVVLTMPAHGSVTVEAVDSHGQPAPDGTLVSLHDAAWDWPPLVRGQMRGLEGGTAAFPYVGVGLELVASADVAQYRRFTTVRDRGPDAPGEATSIRIEPVREGRLLTGKLIAASGVPTDRSWRVSLSMLREDRVTYGAIGGMVRLDSEDRFEFALESSWVSEKFAGTAVFALAPEATATNDLVIACVEFPWPPDDEVHDVGEIHYGGDLLVAGRVEDHWGRPLGGMHVHARTAAVEDDGKSSSSVLVDFTVSTAEDGTFAIHGSWPASTNRLHCGLGREDLPGSSFRTGQDDVLVRLPRLHGVQGRLLLDQEPVPEGALDLQARMMARDDDDENGASFIARVEPDGGFQFRGLPSGAYQLDLINGRIPLNIADLASFETGAEEYSAPAQLAPLDLRGRLRSCRITARSEAGDHLDSVWLAFGEQREYSPRYSYLNPLTLLVPAGETIPASVNAVGHREMLIDWSLSQQTLVLPTLPRVRFHFAGLPAASEEYNSIQLRLRRADADVPVWSHTTILDASLEALAWVPEAGRYEVRLLLLREAAGLGGIAIELPLGDGSPVIIDVPETGIEGTVSFIIDSDDLAAGLVRLRAQR